jgi:hypothetical protein
VTTPESPDAARVPPRRLVPVLTALVLAGSALSLVLALTRPDPTPPADLPGVGSGDYRAADLAAPAGPALEAVVESLPVALGYDFRRLDEGLDDATSLMTRSFARRFTTSFDDSARPLARRERAVVEAPVRATGVVRTDDDGTVVALAYVDQVLVRGTSLEADEDSRVLSRYRVLVWLEEQDGTWLIANLSPV